MIAKVALASYLEEVAGHGAGKGSPGRSQWLPFVRETELAVYGSKGSEGRVMKQRELHTQGEER